MTFRAWQTLIVALIFAILAAASAMAYATKVAQDSERQWCGIVVTLDDAYREATPQTPTGRRLAKDIAELRAEFDCPVRP